MAWEERSTGRAGGESRRRADMAAEEQLAVFLDRYLYARFPDAAAGTEIRRIADRGEQMEGTDVRFIRRDGRVRNIDEKAQLYYLNRDLPTFAFEIQFLRQGVPTVGWLCNGRLDTDYYLLIWPFARRDDPAGISWQDFTRADCLLVAKGGLLAHLAAQGLTAERLLADADRIRARGEVGRVPIAGLQGIYYFASSPSRYVEAPVNLVISRARLRRIAARQYIVTPEGVERR